ncbi:hypothetical protein SNEBB_001127 [Seison nebaliae]|nr:hypothetical protein SNEBB_001127 [Seison nebaliae]
MDVVKKFKENLNEDEQEISKSIEDDDLVEENDVYLNRGYPITSELTIKHDYEVSLGENNDGSNSRRVAALAMNTSGTRMMSGGYDFNLSIFDFTGMSLDYLRPFNKSRPLQSHIINSISFNSTNEATLIIGANSQPMVTTTEGVQLFKGCKGDQYLVDMNRTKGHISMLTCGIFNPRERHEFVSGATDCTLRIWDVNEEKTQKTVIKPRMKNGKKLVPRSCSYDINGKQIVALCEDGSIQMWDSRRKFISPTYAIRDAFEPSDEYNSCIKFNDGGTLLGGRGTSCVKIWDCRKISNSNKSHLFSTLACGKNNEKKIHLPNNGLENNFCFSPDDRTLLLPAAFNEESNQLDSFYFLSTQDNLEVKGILKVLYEPNENIVRCLWNYRLNQIFYSTDNNNVKILFDEESSNNGGALLIRRNKKKRIKEDVFVDSIVLVPSTIKRFRESQINKYIKRKVDDDSNKTVMQKPQPPLEGHGQDGRIATVGSSSLHAFVLKDIADRTADMPASEIRKAILRHNEDAKKNPYYITPAYQNAPNQDVNIYQKNNDDNGLLRKKEKPSKNLIDITKNRKRHHE